MKPLELRGRWVLITGASSGLGKEMARQLARDYGAHLIVVARRLEVLDALKKELIADFGIKVRVIRADLTNPADVEDLYRESIADSEVHAVVLNAGLTYFGRHQDIKWTDFENLLATNVTSVVRLATLFARYLVERRNQGGLLMVSSLGGLLPVPYQAAYAGTKGFVSQFGQSLHEELRIQDVSVTIFTPGGIATEMIANAGLSKGFDNTVLLQPVDQCAKIALDAFVQRAFMPIPGFLNQAQVFLSRLLPRKLICAMSGRLYRDALAKAEVKHEDSRKT